MWEALKVILLSVVEGVTEWLPVSSTGHLILLDQFVQLNFSEEFKDMFFVVIQLGAFLAVVLRYFRRLWPFDPKLNNTQKQHVWDLWIRIIVGCIPAGVIGILFDDLVPETPFVIAMALIVYGILYIILESRKERNIRVDKLSDLSIKDALIIGLFQCLAIVPGTSRSGSTILGALIIGIERGCAVEFSFLLALPVVAGQSLLKILKHGLSFSAMELGMMGLGMVVAFVVSVLVIRFLLDYVKTHDMKAFGIYRIVLGLLVIAYFLFK